MHKDNQKEGPVVRRKSIRSRAVHQYVLFAAGIVLTLSIVSFIVARGFLEQRVLAQLSSIVSAKEDLVEQVLTNDRARNALLATRDEVQGIILNIDNDVSISEMYNRMREEHLPILGMTAYNLSGEVVERAGLSLVTVPPAVERTVLNSVVDEYGWQKHEIFSPVYDNDKNHIGIVGVSYDSRPLLNILISIASVGRTGEVLLGAEKEGDLILLHHRFQPAGRKTLKLGNLDEQAEYGLPLALSVKGKESLGKAEDYMGEKVYAAYRTLPSLGWGLVVKISREEALEGTMRLAFFLGVIGIFLVACSGAVAYILAGRLTNPIVRLSKTMTKLGPGHWRFSRSTNSGDEVELLETVASDMSIRLQDTYERMEEIISDRTEELRQQYEKDRAILESIQHGIITVGKTGVVIGANSAAAKMLGQEITSMIGEEATDILSFYKGREDMNGDNNPIKKTMNSKSVLRYDSNAHMNIEKTDNKYLPVRLVVAPLLDNGKILGAVAVFQDVTDERRVDYMKSEFITLASHQLRTPLSTFQWYLELLEGEESKFNEEQRESISEMKKSGKRMSNLIDTLLHAAQLEGGSISPKIKSVNLTELLEDMAGEFKSLAKDAGCACEVDIPEKDIEIQTDPILLHVIVQNLFSNAIKYSPNKTPVSMIAKVSSSEVKITIKDSGMGIPEQDQPRIFERLFRASNVREMDTTGNGLGLFISSLIAEDMGGKITFSSKENKGSEFVVRLSLE